MVAILTINDFPPCAEFISVPGPVHSYSNSW